MSVCISVFLSDNSLPKPDAWQAAIAAAGFDVEIDTDFDPKNFSGFLPAKYAGQNAGFEFFFGPVDPANESDAGGLSHEVSLVTHSDIREFVSSAIAGAVLAHVARGLLRDDDSGEVFTGQEILNYARNVEKECAKDV
jgi:hypothetical protein